MYIHMSGSCEGRERMLGVVCANSSADDDDDDDDFDEEDEPDGCRDGGVNGNHPLCAADCRMYVCGLCACGGCCRGLSNNQFTGSLPAQLGQLKSLTYLCVAYGPYMLWL